MKGTKYHDEHVCIRGRTAANNPKTSQPCFESDGFYSPMKLSNSNALKSYILPRHALSLLLLILLLPFISSSFSLFPLFFVICSPMPFSVRHQVHPRMSQISLPEHPCLYTSQHQSHILDRFINVSKSFLVAKSNSLRGFVRPSVRPWVRHFSKTTNSRKFNQIQQN